MGGRVYSTAISTLTLEIYYRHTPAYLDDHFVLSADDWRGYLRGADPLRRKSAVGVLADLRYEVGEPVLIDMLRDAEQSVALAAAAALATIDSPAGKPLLAAAVAGLPEWERRTAERALRRIKEIEQLPPASGHVRLYDEQTKIGTMQLPRAYVGMIVDVLRGDDLAARMEVLHRVTGRNVVVVRMVDQLAEEPPKKGDVAIGK